MSPWTVTLSWCDMGNVRRNVGISVNDYKSLRPAVVILTIVVNTHTYTHPDTQLMTGDY